MNLNLEGYTYEIPRLENEVDRSYFMRSWYIVLQKPKNIEELQKVMKMAKLYVNQTLLGVEYHPNVKSLFMVKNLPSCF